VNHRHLSSTFFKHTTASVPFITNPLIIAMTINGPAFLCHPYYYYHFTTIIHDNLRSPTPLEKHTTTILWPFFRDHPGEPVPEENFWTLWCKGRLREADTNQPAGRHSIWTNQCPPSPIFLLAGCPSCRPTHSVKGLKATSACGLGRRR